MSEPEEFPAKQILYVSPGPDPFNLAFGGSQRSNLLLQACSRCGQVDVICFRELDASLIQSLSENDIQIVYAKSHKRQTVDENHKEKFRNLISLWKNSGVFPLDPGKESVIDSFIRQKHYDWIVTRYMEEAMAYGLPKYANRLVVDIDDSPVDKVMISMKRARTKRMKAYLWFYAQVMRKALRSFIENVAVTFFSNSQQALDYHTGYLPNIPFGTVDAQEVSSDKIHRGRLLFVGLLAYYPNVIGIDRFLTHVYPCLKRKDLEIHICGIGLDERIKEKWSAIDGVKILGFVEDMVPEYAGAEIVVIPIYHGAGTCIKVLEAMQMRRLVVTTPQGVRGYDGFLSPNEDYLLAEDDKSFVDLLDDALGNVQLQERMTAHAATVVDRCFNKSVVFDIVKNALIE